MPTALTDTPLATAHPLQSPRVKGNCHILQFTDCPLYQWSECAPEERKNPPSQVRGKIFRNKLPFILLEGFLGIFLILVMAWKISRPPSSELELRLQSGSFQIPKQSSAQEFPVGHIEAEVPLKISVLTTMNLGEPREPLSTKLGKSLTSIQCAMQPQTLPHPPGFL